MARIGIDGTSISPAGKGVSRFQRCIIDSLSKLDPKHEYFVFLNQANDVQPFVRKENWHFIPVPIWKAVFWEQFGIPEWINRLRLDLFHVSSHERLPCFGKGKFLLHVSENPNHRIELARKEDPRYSIYSGLADSATSTLVACSLKRAKTVLVPSMNTQRELVEKYRVDPRKMRIIQHAADPAFNPCSDPASTQRIRGKFGALEGYILHFSTSDPRENSKPVLQAFKLSRSRIDRDIKLLIIGSSCSNPDFQKLIRDSSLTDHVICREYVDETDLIKAYQGALLYLDPSLYEGFALQVLEAMACGAPVIASNRSAIPEVAGNAGILVNPEDPEAIAQALVHTLADENLRFVMRQRGFEQAKKFSWERAAKETLSAFEEVLNGR